jgi:hypothetical protein
MEVRIFGSPASTGSALVRPYSVLVAEAQVAVGNAAVVVLVTASALYSYYAQLHNGSTGGQNISVGITPAFGGSPAGIPLQPGDFILFTGFSLSLGAIASAAGGLLDVFIARTTV